MRSQYPAWLAALLLSVSGAAVAQDQTWQAAAIDKAVQQHIDNLPRGCDVPRNPVAPLAVHDLPIGEDTAAREALLLQLPCTTETSVYLLSDDEGTVSEIRLLTPFVANMGEVDPDSGPARDQVRIDWHETRQVSQPDYDEAGRVLSSKVQWPGEDDSYSAMLWGFRDGRFQLMEFAVDANRNDQDDPEILFKSQLW